MRENFHKLLISSGSLLLLVAFNEKGKYIIVFASGQAKCYV